MMRMIIAAALMLSLGACSGNGNDGSEARDAKDAAGVAATGTGGTRSYDVTGFEAVDLAGSDDVQVTVGPAFSVRAQGDPAVLDRLKVERDGDVLKIGRRGGDWTGKGSVRVLVAMPDIRRARVAGSGNLAVDRVQGSSFEGAVAGSGDLNVAGLSVDELELDIAGSGSIAAVGRAQRLEVEIAGSGDVNAPGLTVNRAEVTVMGSGNLRAAVRGDAEVKVMGSGDVDLGPEARCRTHKMGSGAVRCGA